MKIKEYNKISDVIAEEIFSLEEAIFDNPYTKEKLQREANVKHALVVLIAYEENKPIGYKVGYELSARLFYSWIGGVHPDFRRKGVAKELSKKQQEIISNLGYSRVRTFTENRFKEMLIYNIKYGFNIIGTQQSDHDEEIIIMLEKELN
ncbi:MAG: GNAT family N-acetyltransferase [Bacteriovoracaceae bacterium]|jgi:predicted GNAT superfamily acetyltransferase|nr:GNAT family N-acetyltransferase [Bacteriovoracaceae bacterium]